MNAPTSPSGALISDCGFYRYRLWRNLDRSLDTVTDRRVLWIMLNPSTADADRDDPTLRRCRGFTARWQAERLDVVNLLGYRATDPDELLAVSMDPAPRDVIGDENTAHVVQALEALDADRGDRLIVAWGAHPAALLSDLPDLLLLGSPPVPVECLGYNADGSPVHPLYVPRRQDPRPWPKPADDDQEDQADA